MKRSGIEETEALDFISLTGYGTPKKLTAPAKKNGNFDHPDLLQQERAIPP
jgi:hypothetical protein